MPEVDFCEWIGRTDESEDFIAPAPLAGLAATLDRDWEELAEEARVPPLWHWLYFLPRARASELGQDGHPLKGGFLPPVELPRRMWAGGRLQFHGPVNVGSRAIRRSVIQAIRNKSGRSGQLVFVTVQHQIFSDGQLAISEEQDIVYRGAAADGAQGATPVKAPIGAAWQRVITPDPVQLFRYSALTFNGHRIHYDEAYAKQAEGYPALVVQGPLIATLLLDLVQRHQPATRIRSFSFKALHPTFLHAPFTVCGEPAGDGRTIDLWAQDCHGNLTMQASATTL
ncbi:hypothetical protein OI25_7419 [Paraburkholderia fungorum]|jgi:3-methylfumaryl-CoA hydratase|uniref:MaoC family dehydratase N-terminal domain-containing protein n=1 Tax=Paraburkholderia fungorum TaxID=134537 RepID=A0AAP5V0W2_9BURK|nr:MaoC family dehydratase N-terminal domain-containing protein [Paraburkholderia fungorum]AJZ57049.1 hypothetical protein OI25_7419 [Paraburkholderia fungorum]EIF28041.1 hypothetical protein BCh11DRAFT_07934 [Burkholderia sp. Ch1-1]MDT8843327.1 MaoC family dehydratase N-terminal domain-containing protein [Paraburkholderia fungorum]